MKPRVMTISDVVLGYGSPQILRFTQALSEMFGVCASVLQPLVPEREVIYMDIPGLAVETIPTMSHPCSLPGQIEYMLKCAEIINHLCPDVVIVCSYYHLELVEKLGYKPKKLIHLALEDFEQIATGPIGRYRIRVLAKCAPKYDVWIFPETGRAQHDSSILNIDGENIFVFYNVSKDGYGGSSKKKGRFVYAGTLDTNLSIGRYIFDEKMAPYPIDVYGQFEGGEESKEIMQKNLSYLKSLGKRNRVRWLGIIPKRKLDEVLPNYSFSLLLWLPVRHALLHAAPNKFFQSVAAGVPVITAPHPQTKMLVERYGCGLVLEGWEKEDLINGLRRASKIVGTSAHDQMITNCRDAVEEELSWGGQFERFALRFGVRDWL